VKKIRMPNRPPVKSSPLQFVVAILLPIVLVFPIWFFRYSRMLWMALDLWLNPPVLEDFQARGR
jgi:hypothetical protein